MKKSFTIIGKLLLKALLFIAGFLAFIYMVGEFTNEWWAWAHRNFGQFAYGVCILEKVLAALSIYLVYKLDTVLGPVFEEDRTTKTAEE